MTEIIKIHNGEINSEKIKFLYCWLLIPMGKRFDHQLSIAGEYEINKIIKKWGTIDICTNDGKLYHLSKAYYKMQRAMGKL